MITSTILDTTTWARRLRRWYREVQQVELTTRWLLAIVIPAFLVAVPNAYTIAFDGAVVGRNSAPLRAFIPCFPHCRQVLADLGARNLDLHGPPLEEDFQLCSLPGRVLGSDSSTVAVQLFKLAWLAGACRFGVWGRRRAGHHAPDVPDVWHWRRGREMVAVLGGLLGLRPILETLVWSYLLAAVRALLFVAGRWLICTSRQKPLLAGSIPMAPFFAVGVALTVLG